MMIPNKPARSLWQHVGVFLFWFFMASCCVGPSDGKSVTITFVQLNDVYEMTPMGVSDTDKGEGGLARIATLKKNLLKKNPDTYMVLAGDMVSPSAIGLAKVKVGEGEKKERLAGKQMIAALNVMGMDYMTLGNHEFDIEEKQLMDRIAESQFKWFSSNVTDADGKPFPGVAINAILETKAGGTKVKLGFFGLTLDSAKKDWVSYDMDLAKVARQQIKILREDMGADIVIALTHLGIAQDVALAEEVEGIDLILGGHEHENIQVWKGPHFTPVFKADANGRSVYIHDLIWYPETKKLKIQSRIQLINEELDEDPETEAEVERWVNKAFASFREEGIEPTRIVTTTPIELDGLESSTRNGITELTKLYAQGMLHSFPEATIAIYNSGSIRIDDTIPAGNAITEYDILRILPFGGNAVLTKTKGRLIKRILKAGQDNIGTGGFLQTAGDLEVQDEQDYLLVLTDFLLTGGEARLEFLTPGHEDLTVVKTGDDVRKVLGNEMKRAFGSP